MAFNLKKVLKALLLSTNQPLSVKDIQAAFTRFHDQASQFATVSEEEPAAGSSDGSAATSASAEPTADAPLAASAADSAGRAATPLAASPAAAGAESSEGSAATSAPAADSEGRAATPLAASSAPTTESAEVAIEEGPQDPELYSDVPSLITATQIREAMDQISAELKAADDGILLIEGNNGYRIVTNPRFARWVRILRQEPPPVKLSQSAIETLAVIAYRQPVTRGEIETIRGVSAEAGVNKLLERELIYVVGRADSPGRPIQYGTTDQFLEFVGVKSIDELPASDVLSSRQIDEWLKTSESAHRPNDADMGLPDEQLPLDTESAAEPAEGRAETPLPASGDVGAAQPTSESPPPSS